MAKVMVFEDNETDLVMRYYRLTRNHDVHVRFDIPRRSRESVLLAELASRGFQAKKLDWDEEPEQADIYFVDGLDGHFFNILEKLPKDRAFLNSNNPYLMDDARAEGYQVLETTPEQAIEQVMMGRSG